MFLVLKLNNFIVFLKMAVLKSFSSNVATASIVVLSGKQTISFNSPGCIPVASTIFAGPNTVWSAKDSADNVVLNKKYLELNY